METNEQRFQNESRSIRIFISSTFKDMVEDRDELMRLTWPQLKSFCRERFVELVEVDLRWGISEEQSRRKETLKLCLDEIKECRPFFIAMLGERYGSVPQPESFTQDLLQNQTWLKDFQDRSVTELEILHAVLNNPGMAKRSFFYFRDPAYAISQGPDFLTTDTLSKIKQDQLKDKIRFTCKANNIPVRENYKDPTSLAINVLEDLKKVIEEQFPKESIPNPLTKEALEHEAFAESRRRIYIGRKEYEDALNMQAASDGPPLIISGPSGIGKSALLANWLYHYKKNHPHDFTFQHYIGGSSISADHWVLIRRLCAEIKLWTEDPEELPKSQDDLLKDFETWLVKLKHKAGRLKVRAIIVLDALNQLENKDHAHAMGWLPDFPFQGPLRLILTCLQGEAKDAIINRGWKHMEVQYMSKKERGDMITQYLDHFSKSLDATHLEKISGADASANPLYLKILLDELKVTGSHDRLTEIIEHYLRAKDIPTLLHKILTRYVNDYETDRPGMVKDTLGLIWSSRRGLSETELLKMLRPESKYHLPAAYWAPLKSALFEMLIDKSGILNFSHDYIRSAVQEMFVPNQDTEDDFRLQLAEYFEETEICERSCDELPWLLWKTESFERLRNCLLNIERFYRIYTRNEDELRSFWVILGDERTMGKAYAQSFSIWYNNLENLSPHNLFIGRELGLFLFNSTLYVESEGLLREILRLTDLYFNHQDINTVTVKSNLAMVLTALNKYKEAEPLLRDSLEILARKYGKDHIYVADTLSNLAELLQQVNQLKESEILFQRSLDIVENSFGKQHPKVAFNLCNLGLLFIKTNHYPQAEVFFKRALDIYTNIYGENHPNVAITLGNLASVFKDTNRFTEAKLIYERVLKIIEINYGSQSPIFAVFLNNQGAFFNTTGDYSKAEPLFRRALEIYKTSIGIGHPDAAGALNNLAALYKNTNRFADAETLLWEAVEVHENTFGREHPRLAVTLNNLGLLLLETNKPAEAEQLFTRALSILENSYGNNHPDVAMTLNNLGGLFQNTNKYVEAEAVFKKALEIDEKNFGNEHPDVATTLNNLAQLYKITNRFSEAESNFRRALSVFQKSFGMNHPLVAALLNNLGDIFTKTQRNAEALSFFQQALQIAEKSLGNDHPQVASILNNIAFIHWGQHQFDVTETLFRRTLQILERSYGSSHPIVADALNNLAGLLHHLNKNIESESLYRRSLEITEHSFGPDHPHVALPLNNLAELFESTQRLNEAILFQKRALEILFLFTRQTGHAHMNLEKTIDIYGTLLMKYGYSKEQVIHHLYQMAPDLFVAN